MHHLDNTIESSWLCASAPQLREVWTIGIDNASNLQGAVTELATGARTAIVASGCTYPVALLCACLLNQREAIDVQTLTPFLFAHGRSEPENLLVISARAAHPDLTTCLSRAGDRVHAKYLLSMATQVSNSILESEMHGLIRLMPKCAVQFPDEFVPISETIALVAAVAVAVGLHKEDLIQAFDLACADHLRDIRTTSFDEPPTAIHVITTETICVSASNIETRLCEYGLAPVTISDPWNFGHGRYVPLVSQHSSTAMVFIDHDVEGHDYKRIRGALPDRVPSVRIHSPRNFPGSVIHSFLRSTFWCAEWAFASDVLNSVPDFFNSMDLYRGR